MFCPPCSLDVFSEILAQNPEMTDGMTMQLKEFHKKHDSNKDGILDKVCVCVCVCVWCHRVCVCVCVCTHTQLFTLCVINYNVVSVCI